MDRRTSRTRAIARVPARSLPRLAGAALIAFGLAASPARADGPTRKPGLWEHTMQIGGQAMEARMKQQEAAMASLPPEQRKMMEQMMAKQGVSTSGRGQTVRVCVTPEEAARAEPPAAREGCKQSANRTGNTWNVTFECPARDGRPATSGRGTMTMTGATAYDGQFTTDTTVAGKTEQMTMAMQGHWLADDCGTVKPVRR